MVAALYAYGRLTTPTPSQRDAIALMSVMPPPVDGENGFLLLMPAKTTSEWPEGLRCGATGRCLDAVQSAPEAHERALMANAEALDLAERALRAPTFRNPEIVPRPDAVLPPFQAITRLPARRAFDFLAGREAEALDASCQDAAGLVRWTQAQDSLIHAMITVVAFEQVAGLIAEMRRRAPTLPLPDSCAVLATLPDPGVEGLVCDSVRTEWRMMSGISDTVIDHVPSAQRTGLRWMHSPEQFAARSAERLAGYCGTAAVADAARDAIDGLRLGVPPRMIDRLSFPVSHILDEVANVSYQDYWERQLDHVARRRLFSAWMQMEAMDPGLSPRQRFLALPASLRDGPRALRLDAEAPALVVALRGRRQNGSQGGDAVLPLSVVSPSTGALRMSVSLAR